jgi:threonine dehydratase
MLLHLEVAELRATDTAQRPPLAASCGNAAPAAATLATAGKRQLTVFFPLDEDARIIDRFHELGATGVVCAREADKAWSRATNASPCCSEEPSAVRRLLRVGPRLRRQNEPDRFAGS